MNTSNCDLLKMNSISGFSRTSSNFYTILYGLFQFLETYFREHLLMAAFIHFRRTCFSNQLKVDALFIFFLEYFYIKNYRKKHVPSFPLPWWERIPLLLFIVFSRLYLRPHSLKSFFYLRNLKILISLKRRTFSINHDIHKTNLHKKLIYIWITKKKKLKTKKKDFEKLIEELDFVEWSTQVKYLRLCILHDDWLNDSPRYYC